MSQVLRETHTVERDDGHTVKTGGLSVMLARIVYLAYGIVSGILVLRFVLALLGANPSNSFADFIYSISHPLVAPFFGLFNYRSVYGVSRFELNTLIAIVVYGLLAWVIVRLLMISSGPDVDPDL